MRSFISLEERPFDDEEDDDEGFGDCGEDIEEDVVVVVVVVDGEGDVEDISVVSKSMPEEGSEDAVSWRKRSSSQVPSSSIHVSSSRVPVISSTVPVISKIVHVFSDDSPVREKWVPKVSLEKVLRS